MPNVKGNAVQSRATVIAMDEVLDRDNSWKCRRGAVLRVERDVIGGFGDHRGILSGTVELCLLRMLLRAAEGS